jgi:hypothetical protein
MYATLIDQLDRQKWCAAVVTAAAIISATPHRELVRYCRRDLRAQALFRDLLVRYPDFLWGAPVMIFSTQEMTLGRPELLPCPAVEAVAWMPLSAVDGPSFIPSTEPVVIPANTPTCAVLLIKAAFDDEPEIPHEYWHEILPITEYAHRVYISARMMLPWPDAVEAALVLAGTPRMPGFASAAALSWARDAGAVFRETAASKTRIAGFPD